MIPTTKVMINEEKNIHCIVLGSSRIEEGFWASWELAPLPEMALSGQLQGRGEMGPCTDTATNNHKGTRLPN